MMNWKECGQKYLSFFKVTSQLFPGGIVENHKKSQSGMMVSRPRYKHGTCWIGTRHINRTTLMFGII
jgi:hypothetical protein